MIWLAIFTLYVLIVTLAYLQSRMNDNYMKLFKAQVKVNDATAKVIEVITGVPNTNEKESK